MLTIAGGILLAALILAILRWIFSYAEDFIWLVRTSDLAQALLLAPIGLGLLTLLLWFRPWE
jgi:hypothetical protein